MAQIKTVNSDPGQLTTKYSAVRIVDDERSTPQITDMLISRNFLQLVNILPGILLLSTATFPIICSLRLIGQSNSMSYAALTVLLWYISVSFGAAFGAVLNGIVTVKSIYRANGLLLLVFGIVYIFTLPLGFAEQIIYIIFGAIVPGFIYGVNHVTIILHAVDNSANEIRGIVLRWVPYCQHFILSTVVSNLLIWTDSYFSIQSVGPISVFMAMLVLGSTYIEVHNSFLTTLEKTKDENAVRRLMYTIRNEPNDVGRTLDDLEEMKLMLRENRAFGSNIFTNGNLEAMLLVICARVLSGLFNNLSLILLTMVMVIFTENHGLQICVALFSKLFIGWIVMFVADRFGFNRFFYIAGIVWGLALLEAFLLGELLFAKGTTFSWFSLITLVSYWLISLGVEAISYNQLSEAFPLNKRAGSIALVTFVESLFHIGIGYLFLHEYAYFTFLIPAGITAISCCLLKFMPNTHGKTLREARDMFNFYDVIGRKSPRRKQECVEVPLE